MGYTPSGSNGLVILNRGGRIIYIAGVDVAYAKERERLVAAVVDFYAETLEIIESATELI